MKKLILLVSISLVKLTVLYPQDTLSVWDAKTINGEWFRLNYDGLTDDIYFRPDSTYFVYNEMDVVYFKNSSDPDTTEVSTLIYDNGMETSRTEMGRWIFDTMTKQIILTERKFLKSDSHFSKVFGKEEELTINVRKLSKSIFTMCPENRDYCLSYRDYLSPAPVGVNGPSVEYGAFCKNVRGSGAHVNLTYLSGSQTSLVLGYSLSNFQDSIIFKNLKNEVIGSVTGGNGLSGEAEFEFEGVTELTYEVKSEGSWKMNIEIK